MPVTPGAHAPRERGRPPVAFATPSRRRGRVERLGAGTAAFALVVLALAAPRASRAAAVDVDRIAALLPDGTVTAEVLTPDYSMRMQEVSRRMINAAEANPKWFQSWIAQHPRGDLPWHPNLGVTRQEYDEYMAQGHSAKYTVRTRVQLTFEHHAPERRWTLRGWGVLTPINGTSIDLEHGQVLTQRFGNLPFMGISQPNEPGVQLPWVWYGVWKASHQMGDPRKGGQAMGASFHMGPLGDGKMVGLYWVTRRLNRGRQLADEFLLLRFPARGR